MEYVYTALLLHKAGQDMSAKNMEAVLTAAGVKPDKGRIKALLAALEGVDIASHFSRSSLLERSVHRGALRLWVRFFFPQLPTTHIRMFHTRPVGWVDSSKRVEYKWIH
jgi:hypothetical protein